MDDLVARLRKVALFSRLDWQEHVALAHEAADEIERLREALGALVNHEQWRVMNETLQRFTDGKTSDLVALGLLGNGFIPLTEARNAAAVALRGAPK